MKFLKALAATACALAVASAAQAATYTDSSENYEYATQLYSGVNRGSGFEPWEIEKHGSGDGWAGFGVWNPSANGFQGTWEGKTKAFGIIGKGPYAANAVRRFRQPLAVGDTFSFDMAVNWDPNSGLDALKGFVLGAGDKDVIVVNHLSNPGDISINGKAESDILNAFGQFPMTWTFTAKDATTLSVTATPRDGSKTVYEQDWEVSTSAIDRIRLQSSNQNNVESLPPESEESEQDWADRRQTYFDNFTLDLVDELPARETVSLEFVSGEWEVTLYNQTLSYTVKRSSPSGALDVAICSDNEAFVHPATGSFADGESETTVSVSATLTGSANLANVTAFADGCSFDGQPYEAKGPNYTCTAWEDGVDHPEVMTQGGTRDFYVNNHSKEGWANADNNKVSLLSTDQSVLQITSIGNWQEDDGGSYSKCLISAVGPGTATIQVSYNGPKMCEYDFTVLAPVVPGFELTGPATAKTGDTKTYTLKATLDGQEDECTVSIDPEGAATVDPDDFDNPDDGTFSLVEPKADGFYYKEIHVTFNQTGPVTLAVSSLNYDSNPLEVTVSEPVDPSMFDGYVAYDDASLYDAGDLDFSATGAGQEGFQAWGVFKDSAQYGGAIVDSADGGFPAILADEKAFAIYANGDSPDYAIYRPFVNDLQPGQKASVEFVVPEKPGSALYIQFARVWDGYPYSRFEFWANNDTMGVNIDGAAEASEELSWSKNARRIVASVQRAADGSSYELRLSGYNAGSEFVDDIYVHVVNADVGSWGEGIQGIAIGGYDLASNFIFNKLAIEQVEEPIVERKIGWGEGVYNPEGDGTYTITLTATTTDIGEVAIAVEPADGALSLESDTVDFADGTSATITYTLTGANAGDAFRISATPIDTDVAALTGEGAYGVTVSGSYFTLWCDDGGDFTTDTTNIWMSLSASPSKYGTYTIVSSDPSVIEPSVSSLTLPNGDGNGVVWFDVFVRGVGNATVSIEGEEANWEFHIAEGSGPAAKVLPITGNPAISGKSMILTVDGTPAAVYGATEIVESNWAWQPIEGATIDGDKVTIDMTGIPFLIIKVEK